MHEAHPDPRELGEGVDQLPRDEVDPPPPRPERDPALRPHDRERSAALLSVPGATAIVSRSVNFRQIHHVAYVVADIDAALPLYTERLGMPLEVREVLADQGVEAVSLAAGRGHVELIQPLDPGCSVGRFLKRRGEGLHHVAFEVPDIEAALAELRTAGIDLIDRAPRRGLGGHLVAFLHPRASGGVLTELVQSHY